METTDGRYVKILEIEPINFMLRSSEEQYNILSSFASWLKISPMKLQFKSITRKADSDKHIAMIRKELSIEDNAQCKAMGEDYIRLIKDVGSREALTRRFFLIYQYEAIGRSESDDYSKIYSMLVSAEQNARAYFMQCGNNIIQPQNPDQAVAEILYMFFNRRSCVDEPFTDRVNRVIIDTMAAKGKIIGIDPIPHISVRHFIAPRGLDLSHYNYIVMDGRYYCFLYIKGNGYPSTVRGGWMSSLINAGEGIDIDVHLSRENRSKTIDKVAQRIRLNRTKLKGMQDTSTDYEELTNSIQAGYYIKNGIDGLSPQKLYAKEIAVDDPYWVCDSSVKAITVKANATVSVTFSNTHNGDLRVKKNAVDGSPEGWNFQILDADRELVETITTGEDGYAASSKLEPGTYYVVEIHDRDETYWTYDAVVEKQVTITAGTQSEVEYTNEQFGILVFCKTTNTGNQLGGWTFRVQDSDGNVVGDYTTDETGYASTGKLKPGSYTVLELSNGDDYWNCELGYHSVTIITGKATEDAWHNREQGLGWFHKSTNTGESLEGWEITIYSDKECTQKVTTVTTNADGKVGIYLDPGIYYARESGDTEGRFENEYWLVDESIKEFEILPHKDVDITFVNTQYGKIKVIKSMPSSGSLEGWTFIVRDINGDEIKGSPFITDASGLIVSENLYPGTYAVEEVIPDDSPYICVSENPQSVTVVQGRTAEVRFTNSLRSGKIAIRKVDTTGEPLAGAEFLLEWSVDGTSWLPVVYSNSGYAKEGTCSSEGLTDGRLISDKTGLVEFTGLHPERLYRLTETAAPDGFQLLADTAYEGGLPDDKEYTVDLTVVNVRTYELPETGSKSLVLMPIALILACSLCGAILFVTKRKKQ